MDLKYWAATDVGRKRTDNEDNFLIDQKLRLFVVADGMGGHSSGEIASAMAVHIIRSIVHEERDLLEEKRTDDPSWHIEICMVLEHAVNSACWQIYRKGVQEPEKKGMGTTVVALLIVGDRGYIAYVGDSRIYLLRGGIVYQLTEDHSLMNELIRQGKITEEAFDDSPYAQFKHAMTRAVGPNENVEVDTLDFDLIPGDAFLLCSDGLYEYLDDADISKMLSLTDVKDIPGRLIDMANTRGGKDNITSLVIQVPQNADGGGRAAEINFTLDTLKSIPLFAKLTYQQLVRIMNLTRIVPFQAGEVLAYEGQAAEELFVILRGSIELESGGRSFAKLKQGAHFGEMALVERAPRSATATALTEGKLLIINREDFFEILRKEAPLAVKLLWSFVRQLSKRLRQTNDELNTLRGVRKSATGSFPSVGEGAQPAKTAGAAAAAVEEIVELSADMVVSEDSQAGAPIPGISSSGVPREGTDTVELDPDELEAIDADELGVYDDDEDEELPAGLSAAMASAEAEGVPQPRVIEATARVETGAPQARLARSAHLNVAPKPMTGLPKHAEDDDIHTRVTRPIDVVD